MVIQEPVVSYYGAEFSDLYVVDFLSGKYIALSNTPNNSLNVEKEKRLSLPLYFLINKAI